MRRFFGMYSVKLISEDRHLPFVGEQAKLDAGMSPPRSPCVNPPDGILCQPTASTVVLIVSGMCAMMLLVAVAILLLVCSHLRYSQEQQRRRQEAHETGNREVSDLPCGLNSSDNIVLVLLPGEKDSVAFARPSPLKGDACHMQVKQQALL